MDDIGYLAAKNTTQVLTLFKLSSHSCFSRFYIVLTIDEKSPNIQVRKRCSRKNEKRYGGNPEHIMLINSIMYYPLFDGT